MNNTFFLMFYYHTQHIHTPCCCHHPGPWSTECGVGWTADHLSGNCYYFSFDSKSWQASRNACKKMNSDLVSISSKFEQSFIRGVWLPCLIHLFWIQVQMGLIR